MSDNAKMTEPEWQPQPADPLLAQALARHVGCPLPIAHLLVSRGITAPAEADAFFRCTLDDLHPPHLLLGIPAAVARIQQAVARGEPILIYGDYDVDGTVATVLMKTAIDRLSPVGSPSLVTWHVPHRIREGYGMHAARLAEAAAAGIRLVISVDTGIRAFAAAEEARTLGLDLIVTDHHLPDELSGLPDALAVINPAQPGCPYPFKHLCGAAVVFKLAHALLLAHAQSQPQPKIPLAFLRQRLLPSFLKLLALATIADSVPLTGENRVIASMGLRELANPVQPGLRALMEIASLPLDRAPSAYDVGFRLGPRINAAGRMDVADDVIELFLTRSTERASELAAKLDQLNEDRRATEREALETIDAQLLPLLNDSGRYPDECLILDHPAWHRGVLGILASRVVDRTGRPALVLTHDGEEAHGSGRSIPGFHLLDSLTAAHLEGGETEARLFTRFGGHAHAVGVSLPVARLPLLRQRMRSLSQPRLPVELLQPPLRYDAELQAEQFTEELAEWVERCGPFGNSHPEPVFFARSLRLSAPVRLIQQQHICLVLQALPSLPPIEALGWSRSSRRWADLVDSLSLTSGSMVDLAFRLRAKQTAWFRGLQLELVGMRLS